MAEKLKPVSGERFDLNGLAPEHPVVALCSILMQRGYLDDIEFVEPGIDLEAKEQPGTISIFLKGRAWEEVSRKIGELRRKHSLEWNVLSEASSVPLTEIFARLREELPNTDPTIIHPEMRPRVEALFWTRRLSLLVGYQKLYPWRSEYQEQIVEAQTNLETLGVEPITPFEVEAIVEGILEKSRVVL